MARASNRCRGGREGPLSRPANRQCRDVDHAALRRQPLRRLRRSAHLARSHRPVARPLRDRGLRLPHADHLCSGDLPGSARLPLLKGGLFHAGLIRHHLSTGAWPSCPFSADGRDVRPGRCGVEHLDQARPGADLRLWRSRVSRLPPHWSSTDTGDARISGSGKHMSSNFNDRKDAFESKFAHD